MAGSSPGGSPRASVVMCARNAAPFIRPAIESVLSQSFAGFELIVIDDGSDDDTAGLVAAFSDPRVRLVRNGRRLGVAASRNLGNSLARAPVILVADADDLCLPERFARQIRFLDENPEIGVVGGYAEVMDAEGEPLGVLKFPLQDAEIKRAMRERCALHHVTIAARTEALRACGGYRGKFTAASDYDLLARLSERVKAACLPQALCAYRLTPGSLSIRDRRGQEFCIGLVKRYARERAQSGTDSYGAFPEEELARKSESPSRSSVLARYHLFVGKLAAGSGRMDAAVRHFRRSVAIDPLRVEAYGLLALALAGSKAYRAVQGRFGTTQIAPEG